MLAGEADPRDTAEAIQWARVNRKELRERWRTYSEEDSPKRAGPSIEVLKGEVVSETKAIRVASVKYEGDYSLRIRWVNGKAMSVDLQDPVSRRKGMRALRDKAAFAQASKGEGGHSVVWPGEIDMGADRLWEMTLEQNGRMDTVEFMRWRWRHGLSLSQAAEALDLSRRQVAYYASGERPVPRYVLLALKGWEVEHEGVAA
jgi:hypothetical protein